MRTTGVLAVIAWGVIHAAAAATLTVPGSSATIQAVAMTPVVLFTGGETRAAVLEGFTLTGGNAGLAFPQFGRGGGIFISLASPTIVGNIVPANVACSGGGLFATFGAPLIVGNTFSGNVADCSQVGLSGPSLGRYQPRRLGALDRRNLGQYVHRQPRRKR